MTEHLIVKPRKDFDYPERRRDCEAAMEIAIVDLVDFAQSRGWKAPELLNAIKVAADNQIRAYGRDPDPADEPL